MKAIFTTDLHGSTTKYERLFEIAKGFQADVIINGGDMLPKDKDLMLQGDFIKSYLDGYFEKVSSAGIHHLSYLGNDDLSIFDKLFDDTCNKYPGIINIAQRAIDLEGYEFIGMNWVVDYPFRLKDRCRMDAVDYVFQKQFGKGLLSTPTGWREVDDWTAYARTLPSIVQEMEQLPRPKDMSKAIYIIHQPPSRVGLDHCYNGSEAGSKAIYDFLLKKQPLLSLHGHIHESPELTGQWRAQIGTTVCIQPGQLADELSYVTIDLSDMVFEMGSLV